MRYLQSKKEQRKELKKLFRELILLKWGKKCLRCSKTFDLQVAHIYPVGSVRKMEFDDDNAIPLCQACHLYFWHKNPVEAVEWIKTVLSKETMTRLELRKGQSGEGSQDFKLIKLYLESELKKYAE